MHLSRHVQNRMHGGRHTQPSSSGSSNDFKQVHRIRFRGQQPHQRQSFQKQQPSQPKTYKPAINPYEIIESDEEEDTKVEEQAMQAPQPTLNPLQILEPFKQTKVYPIETIEGLMLLGMLPIPPIPQPICELFAKYTEKCKDINQQYLEQYRKHRKPYHKQEHRGGKHAHHSQYKHQRHHHKKQNRKQDLTGEDFAMIRDFKKTEIQRNEEGVQKTKSKIRSNLNKLTDKTYEKIHSQIEEEMKQMIEDGATDEDYHELSRFVFEVASGNRFYGKLYADLFADMVKNYEFLKTTMNDELRRFVDIMNNVVVASPDDYERFCEVNKQNEQRRALSAFMGHLLRVECIDGDLIGNTIHSLISQSIEWIRMEHGEQKINRACVEEVAEVVYAFIESSQMQATDLNMWEPILSKCIAITQMKRESTNALTSKAKFKYMDILDIVKNWEC